MRNERQEIDNKGLDQILTAKQKQAEKIDQSEDLPFEVRKKIGTEIRLKGRGITSQEIEDIVKKYRG